MDKPGYITKYFPLAKTAANRYDINPVIILAQGALESGWGTSSLAVNANNFFGVTAGGKQNQYWGGKTVKTSKGLIFRKYDSPEQSFYDFARLIREAYTSAANKSNDFYAYARIIAYSKYISEQNGDNRPAYMAGIIANAKFINETLKKKEFLHLERAA